MKAAGKIVSKKSKV